MSGPLVLTTTRVRWSAGGGAGVGRADGSEPWGCRKSPDQQRIYNIQYTIYNKQHTTNNNPSFRDAETAAEHTSTMFLCNATRVPGRKIMLTFNA